MLQILLLPSVRLLISTHSSFCPLWLVRDPPCVVLGGKEKLAVQISVVQMQPRYRCLALRCGAHMLSSVHLLPFFDRIMVNVAILISPNDKRHPSGVGRPKPKHPVLLSSIKMTNARRESPSVPQQVCFSIHCCFTEADPYQHFFFRTIRTHN